MEGERILVLGANGAVGSAVCALLPDHRVLRGVRGTGGDVDTKTDLTLETAGTVDVVIDTVGSPPLTEAAVDRLAPGGRLVFISSPKNEAVPKLAIKMLDFYRREKSLIGVNSIRKSAKDMANLLREIDKPILVEYAQREAKWTEIELDKAVAAYQDKQPGKKYVIKLA